MSSVPRDDALDLAIREHEARSLMMRGEYVAALRECEALLAQWPDLIDTHAALAWLLATAPTPRFRGAPEQIEHARTAKAHLTYLVLGARTGADLRVLTPDEILAAALAEAGDFAGAVEAWTSLSSRPRDWPRLYHCCLFAAGRPYRDTPRPPAVGLRRGGGDTPRCSASGRRAAGRARLRAKKRRSSAHPRRPGRRPLLMFADWLSERATSGASSSA
jgi:hypothetical protein